jgi:YbbR domain-containing protein
LENGFLQKWPRVPEGQNLQFRKKVLLFSVFLLISVFIWFLNALSKNYTTEIEYPLTYEDFPTDRVFVGQLPDKLDLRINAHGWAILRYRIFRKPVPISFKVSAFSFNRTGGDSSRAFILTRYLRDQVSRQLPAELQLLEIRPDTLYFQYAKSVTKMVKIMPDLIFEVDKQFTIKDGIDLEPDSVEVTGPDLIVDTLKQVFTARSELGQLSKNFTDKVRLNQIPDLTYSHSRVKCNIELERFTEVQLTLPVSVINVPDTISLQTFPSRIRFTCNVGLSKYDRVDGNLIRAVVDYEEIRDGTRLVNVHIQNLPVYLLGYEYYPRTVEFLKSRK